jgi:CubicO group peptidase (beta-lactamase class C family)
MLGSPLFGVFGRNNPNAFGHLGLSNNLTWADPDRGISVVLLTTGKAIMGPHVIPLVLLINEINSVFDKKFAEEPSEVFRQPG